MISCRFLVALTEKQFATNYFGHDLLGAQADQLVLKDILEQKVPELVTHFQQFDFDLSSMTLNWFLPLFFDSLPIEV